MRDRRHPRNSRGKSVPQRTVSMPAYLTRFQCRGGACENTCCAGWMVPVDEPSYDRYVRLPDGAFRARLLESLVRAPSNESEGQWSLRLREEDNACHFLSPAGLCTLQQQRGPQFLCLTCASYPRVAVRVDGAVQRAAVLSCPEVVRLALFSPRAMTLVRRTEPANTQDELAADITTSTAGLGDPMASFDVFRGSTLQILRLPVPLEVRLTAIGDALSGLRAEQLSPADVRRVFSDVLDDIGTVRERVCRLERSSQTFLPLLRGLEPARFFDALAAGGYRGLAERLLGALGAASPEMDDATVVSRFACAAQRFYEPYVAAHPTVLENFLINCVYATAFPFTEGKDPFLDYLTLVMRYCLLKVHLIGLAAAEGKLNDALVVAAVHRLERAVNHNQQFRNHVLALMMTPQMTMEDVAPIIVA